MRAGLPWRHLGSHINVLDRSEIGNRPASNHAFVSSGALRELLSRLTWLITKRMGKTKGLDLPHDPADQSGDLPSLVTVDGA